MDDFNLESMTYVTIIALNCQLPIISDKKKNLYPILWRLHISINTLRLCLSQLLTWCALNRKTFTIEW